MMTRREKRKRKKSRFSKGVISLVILLNILYTVAVLYIVYKTGSEPMTLTGCWFAFTTGELWMLSSIKKSKVKNNTANNNCTDNTNNTNNGFDSNDTHNDFDENGELK